MPSRLLWKGGNYCPASSILPPRLLALMPPAATQPRHRGRARHLHPHACASGLCDFGLNPCSSLGSIWGLHPQAMGSKAHLHGDLFVPADLRRACGTGTVPAPGVSPYQLKAFPNKHHLRCRRRGPFEMENKKKKGANGGFGANNVPREVGEHRGHREQLHDSPGPLGDRPLSPRRWPHLPSSSPRGSTSSGGSTGIGCGGAGRSGSRGWTCGQDRAR